MSRWRDIGWQRQNLTQKPRGWGKFFLSLLQFSGAHILFSPRLWTHLHSQTKPECSFQPWVSAQGWQLFEELLGASENDMQQEEARLQASVQVQWSSDWRRLLCTLKSHLQKKKMWSLLPVLSIGEPSLGFRIPDFLPRILLRVFIFRSVGSRGWGNALSLFQIWG